MTTSDVAGPAPSALMMQLIGGFQLSQAVYVVVDTGVATILEQEGPKTVAELSARTGTQAAPLGRLIRTLASFGVFTTDGDRVAVTPAGELLSSEHAHSLARLTRMWMETHYLPFSELRHSVRTGTPGSDKYLGVPFLDWVNAEPARVQIFSQAMADMTAGLRTGMFDGYTLPAGRTVADLGGSDGSMLAELMSTDDDPHRQGILFELPTTAPSARATLARMGMSERVTVVTGDFFHGVPTADVYVLSYIFHDWTDEQNQRILSSIRAAAQPGARVLIIETVVPPGDAPDMSKLIDLTMLGMMGGQERTEGEYRHLLASMGFSLDRVVATPSPYSIVEATMV